MDLTKEPHPAQYLPLISQPVDPPKIHAILRLSVDVFGLWHLAGNGKILRGTFSAFQPTRRFR
ncbi:MAG: hypothetical protein A3K03_04475 [Bdellovibrionales bacterium RIFOXYD1_FULL_44_7]|nr:MAG: hypothetical protein A3K03_04475 [Bdellovibrionales bacterium RIFOXYD1_FULL_44_7]